jgi:hypothetical protein
VHGEFYRIADDDEERFRDPDGALLGDVFEDAAIHDAHVSAGRAFKRHGNACGDDNDVGIHVENFGHDFNLDTLVIEGIEQIDARAEQLAFAGG